MKILYVEDNDDNVYMLKNRLARAGFTRHQCQTEFLTNYAGKEAAH